MADFILLMHNDAPSDSSPDMWQSYIAGLRQRGVFDGGSSVGLGAAFRNDGTISLDCFQLSGFIRIRAENAEEARQYLSGNPVFEGGGTVEIRALPVD